MTRLTVFLSVLTGFVLILVLNSYKNLPVNNSKFDMNKVALEHKAHVEAIEKAKLAHESEPMVEEEVKEIEVKIDLNTPELVNGNKVYSKCIACHGKIGEGKTAQKAPHIGGQYDWYIEKQLTDMKSGARINEAMVPTLKGLSDQDIKDVAQYVSKLPWKKEELIPITK